MGWDGIFKAKLDKIGFRELIQSCEHLPSQNSYRAYGIDVILESFITRIWCGTNRFLHTEITRSNKALVKIFDWKQTPAQDAYKLYWGKFNQSINQAHFWLRSGDPSSAHNFVRFLEKTLTNFGAESFNLKGFFPTETALFFSMITCNLMPIFRLFAF